MIALEAALHRVSVEIYGTMTIICSRNMNPHNLSTVDRADSDISIYKNIAAHFIAVERIPEIFDSIAESTCSAVIIESIDVHGNLLEPELETEPIDITTTTIGYSRDENGNYEIP